MRQKSTEREGRHMLLCGESRIQSHIAPGGYGGLMHRLELARSAQPQVVEVARGWSDTRERVAVPSHAVNAFCSDRNQK
jgi:hypothetical protein